MHKKRIGNRDYFYTTIREKNGKTKTIYLGSNKKKATSKEEELGLTHKKNSILPKAFLITFILVLAGAFVGFSFTGNIVEEVNLFEEKTLNEEQNTDQKIEEEEIKEEGQLPEEDLMP